LCKSPVVWERRISILSTLTFIRANQFEDCLKVSGLLLGDKHDLIHKAVGWMLREVGKKEVKVLDNFIEERYDDMPRTTLRYAIERFPE
jgi:3-methyladenine DNA glycosylase AlkD